MARVAQPATARIKARHRLGRAYSMGRIITVHASRCIERGLVGLLFNLAEPDAQEHLHRVAYPVGQLPRLEAVQAALAVKLSSPDEVVKRRRDEEADMRWVGH